MTKTNLIAKVAEMTGLTKKEAEKAVSAVFASMTEALAEGDKVSVAGFGAFEVRERAARVGRNPQTKAEIKIEASKRPVFTAGAALKNQVK